MTSALIEARLEGRRPAALDAPALINGDVLPRIQADQAKLYRFA